MKVLLHGATNRNSSNYGDFLYGEIMFDYFANNKHQVIFYQPSSFFKKYITNYSKQEVFSKNEADIIVYIPGGYFGIDSSAKLKRILIHFLRFFPLGIWASHNNKKIIIIGIGAYFTISKLIRYSVKRICESSIFVTTRDHISFEALKTMAPKANIAECGDLILTRKFKELRTRQIEELDEERQGRKILLVHYNHDKIALSIFAKAVNAFIQNHKDYYVVVTSDSVLPYNFEDSYFKEFVKEFNGSCYHFIYNDPREMTMLIKISDVVLTCKLHVGVVACTYNKSVIVAACDFDKTRRFYQQIGYEERCVELQKTNYTEMLNLLQKYHDSNITIAEDIIEKANYSWLILKEYLENINAK